MQQLSLSSLVHHGPLTPLLQLIQLQCNTLTSSPSNLEFGHRSCKGGARAYNGGCAFTEWKKRWIIQIDQVNIKKYFIVHVIKV